ncbi:MAG: hypothetical protein OSB09_11820 [Planctomycetota bacterium]|nr:hypothetical protein [Planctomycetota bacterium]
MSHQRPSIFRTSVQLLAMGFLVALVGCNSSSSIRDEDAVESAQIITKNRAEVNKIVLSVMEAVDLDNADSILVGIRKYEQAVVLLDEAVTLAGESIHPRMERFSLRKRIADGYQALYAIADEQCTPFEKVGATPPQDQIQRRAEAEVGANKWLKLARRDMDFHLRSTTPAYQNANQYWAFQQIDVALGDYSGARSTLLNLLSAFGTKLSAADRKVVESRIRLYAQKMNDAEI